MKKLLSITLLLALAMMSEANELVTSEIAGSLAFGFRENDASTLRAAFNDAILSMKLDGTITILQAKYLCDSDIDDTEAVYFRIYNAADTIRAAITDETKIFNLAVLAETGRRLRLNVELVTVAAETQMSALTSGDVDVILLPQNDE